jgi:hypothetical protein
MNTFIITSTINTQFGLISPENRFNQTLETIESIKSVNCPIIMIDNSNFSLSCNQYKILKNKVDYFIDIGQRKHSLFFNKNGVKGAGECYMLLVALDILKKHFYESKRIFKISGRYKLSKEFNINTYNNLTKKYCFKTREKNDVGNYFLHSRMWSFCGTLLLEAENLIKNSFNTLLKEQITIEECIYKNIDFTKLIEFDKIYCEGYIAPWNILITD